MARLALVRVTVTDGPTGEPMIEIEGWTQPAPDAGLARPSMVRSQMWAQHVEIDDRRKGQR